MKNFVQKGKNLTFVASQLTGPNSPPKSSDPVFVGRICGVVNADAVSSGDNVVVSTEGVFLLAVKSYTGGIIVGQAVYMKSDGSELNDYETGIPFGVALGTVANGQTTTIPVRLFGATPGAAGQDFS